MASKLRPYRPPVYTHNKEHRQPGASPSGDPSPQFPLFAQLPAELRLKIWEYAAATPQVLLMDRHFALHSESGLLAACTTSRAAFLQFPDTVRVHHGSSAAPKGRGEPRRRNSFQCRLGLDLVVVSEEAEARLRSWAGLQRLPGAREIRHLAIPYHAAFVQEAWRCERWSLDERMTTYFPRLRTWEFYAGWIDSLDQQAADGRRSTDANVIWIPPFRGLRLSVAKQLLELLDPINAERHKYHKRGEICTWESPCSWHAARFDPEHKKKLVGRPIFDIDRAALGLDP